MLNLNMQIQSINLSKEIVNDNDSIRVSITTLPDGQKQAHTLEYKKINNIQPSFKIQMNNQTEKIVIVFRKQNIFSSDNIIASTVLHSKDMHIFKEMINNEHKKVPIYEPIQGKNNNKQMQNKSRRILGNMEIEFSLSEDFSKQYFNKASQNQHEVDALLLNQLQGNQDFLFKDPIYN